MIMLIISKSCYTYNGIYIKRLYVFFFLIFISFSSSISHLQFLRLFSSDFQIHSNLQNFSTKQLYVRRRKVFSLWQNSFARQRQSLGICVVSRLWAVTPLFWYWSPDRTASSSKHSNGKGSGFCALRGARGSNDFSIPWYTLSGNI